MIIAAAVAGYMVSLQLHPGLPTLGAGTLIPQPRPLARFALTDHQGDAFNNGTLLERPHLLFFGFTNCPDVCPVTLALMAQLGRQAALAELGLVFVTVDPARDDQATLQRYVQAFGGSLIGLRGEDAALGPLLQSLGAARSITPLAGGSYTVDHTAALFYVNQRGRLAAVFTPPFELANLQEDLERLMRTRH